MKAAEVYVGAMLAVVTSGLRCPRCGSPSPDLQSPWSRIDVCQCDFVPEAVVVWAVAPGVGRRWVKRAGDPVAKPYAVHVRDLAPLAVLRQAVPA
ncbi:MAG: hypothetical protein QOJ92_3052 [Frankiales bacterium]|nr:hypothetical protein [Frankiales bacterium]